MFSSLSVQKRLIVSSALLFVLSPLHAKTKVFYLVLENHVFTPTQIIIPANQKVKIVIENKDNTAEEFDSFDLNRERVIFAKRKATIFVGPLPTGEYEFFGEFHPQSARGVIVVKEDKK